MKIKFKVGFGATIQAIEFHPVEVNDSIEIEMVVKDEKEFIKKYEHFQEIVQQRVIKSVITGAKEFNIKRAEVLEELHE